MNRRDFLKLMGIGAAGFSLSGPFALVSPRAFAKSNGGQVKTGVPRWAMVIDIGAITGKPGSRDFVEACHRVHNVPDFKNPRHEIKWIWTAPYGEVFPEQTHGQANEPLRARPTIVLCNHCENPPCVAVCPTKATFRRDDGIVAMDYHRCIGCRYCMAACPYGSRSFNWKDPRPFVKQIHQDFPTRTRGVVEKCNFCEERLAKGLVPACVEAGKGQGLFFGDLNNPGSDVAKLLGSRFSMQRKAHLGTGPRVYYIV